MNPEVESKFNSYPRQAQERLLEIRKLIFSVAEKEGIAIEETLKWGEPSYLSANGSTLRIDWKEKQPKSVSIYFNCKTILVETIREIFGDLFVYVGTREIIIPLNQELPEKEISIMISMALNYHKIKHLPLLGF